MYRPSSGNNAALLDVWGSALAVTAGAAPTERAAGVVRWLGAHWEEVVQAGQVRKIKMGKKCKSTAFNIFSPYKGRPPYLR